MVHEFEILWHNLLGDGSDLFERLTGEFGLVLRSALSLLDEMVPDFVEACEIRYAYFTHKFHFELFAISAQLGRLNVASLLELFFILDGVL